MLFLGRITTVFQAEIPAIHLATNELLDRGISNQKICFFSDSQAAIKALACLSRLQNSVLLCTEALNQLDTRSIPTYWVPGHRDFVGNEMADAAAKSQQNMLSPALNVFTPFRIRL